MIKIGKVNSFLLIFLLAGCATNYQGPGPDLSLKGKAADEEIKKFSFAESYWRQGKFFSMGPDRQWYKIDSVRPFVEKISPRAIGTIETAETWRVVGLIGEGVALVGLILDLSISDPNPKSVITPIGLIGFGTWIGSIYIYPGVMARAAREYNEDLRQKFTPSVALGTHF